jgi:pimeloyl-ACP methyl ester carboxylesterase
MTPTIIYCHGFASSPGSTKANIFARRFEERGISVRIPDLNVPDFEHLTLTAMLKHVDEEVRACPPGAIYLMGSSLGGVVALHFTDRYRDSSGARVEKLLLMAPAFDFAANRKRQLGESGLAHWSEIGWREVYHYGYKEPRRIHYGLHVDALTYDSFGVSLDLPILIYHGTGDESVDYHQSVRFAENRPNVQLHLLDSDHELLDQVDVIWEGALTFFGV